MKLEKFAEAKEFESRIKAFKIFRSYIESVLNEKKFIFNVDIEILTMKIYEHKDKTETLNFTASLTDTDKNYILSQIDNRIQELEQEFEKL